MKVQNKAEIVDFLRQHQADLVRLGVRRVGLFGSYARGEQQEDSDIDLLVDFDADKKTYDNFIDLIFYLEDHWHRPVDVTTTEALSPFIGPHVLRDIEYVAF